MVYPSIVSNSEVGVESRLELTVEYHFSTDLESDLLEAGEIRSTDPPESGWLFRILGQHVMRVADTVVDSSDSSLLAQGGGPQTLQVIAAIAIDVMQTHMPPGATEIATHVIDGSEVEFKSQFAEAFNLVDGAPELIPVDD